MKRYLAWFAAALVGAVVGASVMGSYYVRLVRVLVPAKLQQMEDEQRYRCVLSMAVLERLESDQPDRAKLLLAREVASYYTCPLGLAESGERKKVLAHIDSLRTKSKTLKEELSKETQ